MQHHPSTARLLAVALVALVVTPICAEDNLKFGQPACPGQVLDKTFYVVCYSSENKIPIWVEYALTKDDLAHPVASRTEDFRPDPNLPAGQRAELKDYENSGYDRGHMAPAADFERSKNAMSTTFLLSNMVPQRPNLNRIRWKQLETVVRKLAKDRGSVWIVTGPVFAGNKPIKTIGPDKVAVPSHCFKVVLTVQPDGSKEMFAEVILNTNGVKADLAHYAQTVRSVEKLTGLDFFSALPTAEQDILEKASNTLPTH